MANFNISRISAIENTPFYFYDMELLSRTLDTAKKSADRYGYHLHFAVKANSEPRILKEIAKRGIGADCVSGWEIERCIECGFAPESIVFAGVGKSDREIEYALKQKIFMFNIESIEEIGVISELAASLGIDYVDISIRINPDIEPETHKFISTGHSESKFGIPKSRLNEACDKINQCHNLKLKGIHMHIGSQILDMGFFENQAKTGSEILCQLKADGYDVEVADMGGGLGIDYENPDLNPISDFDGYFDAYHRNMPDDINLHFEIGRALVAQCGELISKVLYTKNATETKKYIIIDAGMTELIRPALYGAKHQIKNISAQNRENGIYTIGGPICESSDIFANDITFPESKRGDILSIKSAGAYGSIMSSHYNLRPTAPAYFSDSIE